MIKKYYTLAKAIEAEYEKIEAEEIKEIFNLTPEERYKIFEELCEIDYQMYKAAKNYAKKYSRKTL